MDALGMIEINSVAAGIEAGDAMLKTAGVTLINAQSVCAGKYIVTVQGAVAEVTSSVNAGKESAGDSLVDSFIIPNVHPQVFSALACASDIDVNNAVGVIETFSLSSCVVAADAAVKAADVELLEIRLGMGLGGKSFVVLSGDVSAVRHSVESAESSIGIDGLVVRTAFG